MKNTERLPKKILQDIRDMVSEDIFEPQSVTDEKINLLSNNELLDIWLEKKLVGSIFDVELKSGKPKEWCCWILSEDEIMKAMVDVGVSVPNDEKDDFIEEIADNFEDCLSIAADEWGCMLKQCVEDVFETWNR